MITYLLSRRSDMITYLLSRRTGSVKFHVFIAELIQNRKNIQMLLSHLSIKRFCINSDTNSKAVVSTRIIAANSGQCCKRKSYFFLIAVFTV